MNNMILGLAATAALAMTGTAWGQAINKTCPVKGTPVKAVTAEFEGKTIGFC